MIKKLSIASAIACLAAATPALAVDEPRLAIATFLVFSTKCPGAVVTEDQRDTVRFYALIKGIDLGDQDEAQKLANIASVLHRQAQRAKGGLPAFCRSAGESISKF
ncbi:MAG: hypothetical protein O9972_39735 [Burkholderiales bacterium]|nr:hypothetical protein [Burkholderiales bacterium]